MQDEEIWKPVVGHEADYEVSNMGRVRSADRVKTYEHRNQYNPQQVLTVTRRHKGRVLKPWVSGMYFTVAINAREHVYRPVHYLVLEAFVGQRPEGMEARHLNDQKLDNRLENLSWGTRIQNAADALRNRTRATGERIACAKLKASDIPTIRVRLETEGTTAIAADYGVCRTAIWQIKVRKSWRHVP